MEDIIERIMEFEKTAQGIMDEAHEERKNHESRVQQEIEAYREQKLGEAREQIAQAEAKRKQDARDRIRKIEEDAELDASRLAKAASAQKAEWTERLYAKIVAGEIG